MRICVLGITIPPDLGGLQVHTWELSRHLAMAGHSVYLITWHNTLHGRLPDSSTIDGVRIFRLQDCRYKYYWWPAFRLANRLHSENRFDVVHAHTAFPAGLAGALLSIWKRVPLVITSHGSEIRRPMSMPLMNLLRYLIVRFSFSRADAVVGASRELVQLSIKFGANGDSTFYMANATDTKKFHPGIDGTPARKRHNIGEEDVVVLFLGHFEKVKGVDYFLRAAGRFADTHSGVKFLVVGMGNEEEHMFRLIESLGLRDRFIFAGEVGNDEVPAYIAAADLAVFPSLAEATSIACLETMACGCPVVVSNSGGLPEIVEDGKTGLIVDFPIASGSGYDEFPLSEKAIAELTDAMARLIGDKEFRAELGQRASAAVRSRFTWQNYVARIENIYRRDAGEAARSEKVEE